MSDTEKQKFFGYVNRWGRIVVKLYDPTEEIMALESPSVFRVFRFIEAYTQYEAEREAERRNKAGEGMITEAGRQEGLK